MLTLYLLVDDMLDILAKSNNCGNLEQCGAYHAIWDLEGVGGSIPKIKRSPYHSKVYSNWVSRKLDELKNSLRFLSLFH